MTRPTPADFARFAATANAARRASRPAPSPLLGRSGVPSGAPMGARTGRDSLMALGARVNQARVPDSLANVLSDAERDELTVIAYTHLRNQARREFAAERVRTLRELGQRVAAMRTSHDEDCGCTHEGTVREHPDFTYRRIETPSRKARP